MKQYDQSSKIETFILRRIVKRNSHFEISQIGVAKFSYKKNRKKNSKQIQGFGFWDLEWPKKLYFENSGKIKIIEIFKKMFCNPYFLR